MSWEWEANAERKEILFEIQKTLCSHHRNQTVDKVHPKTEFLAPDHFGPFLPAAAASPSRSEYSLSKP